MTKDNTKANAGAVSTKPATSTSATPALKKGPSPVFSIPATKAAKDFISMQSDRTGKSQKELLDMAIEAGRKQIEGLPKYVEPQVEVKASKAKKADAAEAALKAGAAAPQAPATATTAK